MKKIFSVLISVLMIVTMFGCAKNTNGNSYNIQSGEKPENNIWNLDGTIFPLKDKVKFTVLTEGYSSGYDIAELANNFDWQQLMEATNVEIEFVSIGKFQQEGNRENLQLRFMSEEYGDAIWSWYVNDITTADIDELASAGIAIELDKYMTDKTIMPNFSSKIAPDSNVYKNMKSADGKIHAFQGVSELKANDAGEALMQVNVEWMKAWQIARGIDHSPATLDEFEDMLEFFKTNDLNGNGVQDETPYFICQSYMMGGCASFEHAMGVYGIGTKDSALDMDIMIGDDGKCYYAYTTDKYKAALEKFAEWYGKGYIYKDAFTATSETVTSIVAEGAKNFGLINICEPVTGFETILPPTIDGYTAAYHMHPSARTVSRQAQAIITDKCEHPEILAAFFDLFYNFENYVTYCYGSANIGEGCIVEINDGKYVFDSTKESHITGLENTALGGFIAAFEVQLLEDFDGKVDMDAYYGGRKGIYRGSLMYRDAGVWNKTENLWPRCSILEDDATDYTFKYTDVSAVVSEYRAKFITGVYDVNAKWDEFQRRIKDLGVEDMTAIIQKAYDAWLNK